MAESQPTADDPVLEQLVAYLDGELSPAENRAVEERLASDAHYRRQLQQLQHSWDALDVLPRTEVDESFTRTTVELVALRAADDRDEAKQSAVRQRTWTWAAIAGGALLAVGVGFLLVNSLASRANDKLLRDLPVIEQVDIYRQAESIDFLRQLDRAGLFEEESGEAGTTMPASSPTSPVAVQAADLEAERARVEALEGNEKEALRLKRERFERLSIDEQQHLRRLHEQISAAPDADRLRRVMARYHEWLQTLASGQRADLVSLAPEPRLAEMKKIRDDQARERLRRVAATRLTPEDARTIFAWLGELVQTHEAELVQAMPEDQRQEFAKVQDENRKRRWLFGSLVFNRNPVASNLPSAADIDRLIGKLSDEPRKQLQQFGNFDDRRRIVKEWLGASMNRFSQPQVTDKELEEFYVGLDKEKKSELEALPPDKHRDELRRLFFISRFRKDHEGKWGGRPGPGGGFRPEGGGPPGGPGGQGPGPGSPGGPGGGRRGDRDGRDGPGQGGPGQGGPGREGGFQGGPRPPGNDKGPRPMNGEPGFGPPPMQPGGPPSGPPPFEGRPPVPLMPPTA